VLVSSSLGLFLSKLLFAFDQDGIQLFMVVYVDDIVIAGSTPATVESLVRSL
jgi:hypothetical protein